MEDRSKKAKDINKGGSNYKDPDFYKIGGANSMSGAMSGLMQLQQQTSNTIATLQSLGVNVGSPVSYDTSSLFGQSASDIGVSLAQLGMGGGLTQAGGASVHQ